jgi:endonuclease/exonuclease/phosphatase family metal-dependent hydrolase
MKEMNTNTSPSPRPPRTAPPGAGPVRLATYNIRKCVGLDRRRDPDRVLEVVAGLDADLVALQEADRRIPGRPATLCSHDISARTGMEAVSVTGGRGSLGWHGNAILLRRGGSVSRVEQLDLDGFEPRGALLAEVTTAAGVSMRVVATHLGLIPRHRRAQLQQIRRWLSGRDARPTVIMGDFNDWSKSASAKDLGPVFDVHTPGRSYHAARPVAGLDRIATCGRLTVTGGGVEQGRLARRASDHLPVWVDAEPQIGGADKAPHLGA